MIDTSSNVQEQIPRAFCSVGCEQYEDDRGSSLPSAEIRKISEDVRNVLRVIVQDVLSSSRENQRRVRTDTGKEVMQYASGIFSDFERQKQKNQQPQITMR